MLKGEAEFYFLLGINLKPKGRDRQTLGNTSQERGIMALERQDGAGTILKAII